MCFLRPTIKHPLYFKVLLLSYKCVQIKNLKALLMRKTQKATLKTSGNPVLYDKKMNEWNTEKLMPVVGNKFLFGFKFIPSLCNITDGTANR